MDDGFKVPGLADGMGAFSYQNKTILIRNHELQFYDGWKLSPFNSPKKDIKMLKTTIMTKILRWNNFNNFR